MPTIECWHVARWIALFESQITRRLPSTSSCGPPPSAVPKLAPFLPCPTARPSFSCSTSLLRRLSTSETSGREEKEKGPHSKAASAGNLPHAYVAACLSFLSSRLERSLRQRQPNPPRYSPAYRRSDAISMTGDVQALIRGMK